MLRKLSRRESQFFFFKEFYTAVIYMYIHFYFTSVIVQIFIQIG